MERFEKVKHSGFYIYFVIVFSVLFLGLWLALKTVPVAVSEKAPAVSPLPPDDLGNFAKKEVQRQPQVQVVEQAEYVPDPADEYEVFYSLLKEKLSQTRQPEEVLRYVNDLKAVSARLYLEYYRASDPKVRELRAAVREAILKAFQENNFKYYPNRPSNIVV